MSKAFTKETERDDDDDLDDADALPQGQKNYMTPYGFSVLQNELHKLQKEDRPKVVEIVSWAAGNGDRSENGDYIYGKKKLREIDRRLRFLIKRLESAEVVHPHLQTNRSQVFFGATVTYERSNGKAETVKIVGIDEANFAEGKISFLSPIARALLKASIGDVAEIRMPSGTDSLEILLIDYD